MNTITTTDGTEIYYKDWGDGPTVTFSHGGRERRHVGRAAPVPRTARFRVIAHDRRGHGRSGQPSSDNDLNGSADTPVA